MNLRRTACLMLLGLACSTALVQNSASREGAAPTAPPESFAIQHPLTVRLSALDPVRHGATVRVRLDATSHMDLHRVEARLVSPGGATPVGAARARIGRMRAGRPAATEFAVRMPERGHRVLLQFQVTGEGVNGLASRGATLNLLPDGPADPGRETMIGGERVIEYRARRIGR